MSNTDLAAGSPQRIAWRVAIPVTLVGAALIVAGLFVDGVDKSAVSAVMINVGTAIGLVLVIGLLQRRMLVQVARVAQRTAEETVERETSELRERVVRLENLDETQTQERERRREAGSALVRRLLNDELSPQVVGEVLADAFQERLLDSERFHVRTSASPDAHVLYFLALKADNGVPLLWLDVQPFEWGDEVFELSGGGGLRMPLRRDTTVVWIHDQDAAQIASELERGLERANRPAHGFSFSYALHQLARSAEIAAGARTAPEGDARRLRGTLIMPINDDWAITSFGLESIKYEIAYQANWAQFGPRGIWHRTTLHMSTPPADGFQAGWDEAFEWVIDREGWVLSGRP